MEERRIMELDIDETTDNIYEFYREVSGKEISRVAVYDFVNTWSLNKFDLYKKMGNKLSVSTIVAGKTIVSQEDFRIQIESLLKRRVEKRTAEKIDLCAINAFRYVLNHYADWQGLSKNTFSGHIWEVESLIRCTFNTPGIVDDFSFEERLELSNKSKLTKVISAYFKNPKIVSIIGADNCQLFSHQLISFLSEIKQACESGSKEIEVVFSIHPYDYVTMSWNTLNWRSCYSPDGEYAKSVFSVMADNSTVVVFSPSSTKFVCDSPVVQNNKKVRNMIHFDTTLTGVILNTTYPASAGAYHGVILKALPVVGLLKDFKKDSYDDVYIALRGVNVSSAIYNDIPRRAEDPEGLERHIEKDSTNHTWEIGIEAPICMACGSPLIEGDCSEDSDWYCHDCDPEYYQEDDYVDDYSSFDEDSSNVIWNNVPIPEEIVQIKRDLFLDLSYANSENRREVCFNSSKERLFYFHKETMGNYFNQDLYRNYTMLGSERVLFTSEMCDHVTAIYLPDEY